MRTSTPQATATSRVPVQSTLHAHHDERQGEGTIWGLSVGHFHIESPVAVFPGMTLSLFVILPGTQQAILIDEALVTWVRGYEFGAQIQKIQPPDAECLQLFLITHA